MKTVTTEQYDLSCLKAAWKNATTSDWLSYASEHLIILKNRMLAQPEATYHATELLLLSKKLEVLAKSLGGENSVWGDQRE